MALLESRQHKEAVRQLLLTSPALKQGLATVADSWLDALGRSTHVSTLLIHPAHLTCNNKLSQWTNCCCHCSCYCCCRRCCSRDKDGPSPNVDTGLVNW
jgi:hypothetical protein